MDLKRLAKSVARKFRQYVGRLTVADRYLRGEGLEIGALQDPLAVPRGVTVRYVDIAETAALRALYADKSHRHLVEVDIVDDGERLTTVGDGSQDFAIANHFLEHCEDPIGALRNLLRVVRPDGVVYLSVPDKRFTFDRPRPVTTLAHVLHDHEAGPEGSRAAHYDEVVRLTMGLDDEGAIATKVQELRAQEFRIHFHCWTQLEFLELLVTLQRRPGYPAFAVEHFTRNECELVVVLRRAAAPAGGPA
ncbi:MAG: methyltransferase domain-containing protein [Planctomycetota bacterium]